MTIFIKSFEKPFKLMFGYVRLRVDDHFLESEDGVTDQNKKGKKERKAKSNGHTHIVTTCTVSQTFGVQ